MSEELKDYIPGHRTVWTFDSKGWYLGVSEEDEDPMTPGSWMTMPLSTTTPPPADWNSRTEWLRYNVDEGWQKVSKPKVAADLEGVVVPHASQSAHDVELRQLMQNLANDDPAHWRAILADGVWCVDRVPEPTEAELWERLRSSRDGRLAACDYRMTADVYASMTDGQKSAWTAYRQALRDITDLEGAPWDGGGSATPWPSEPKN